MSVCMYELMYVCVYVCMYVRPFNNWAVPAGLRLGAITWGEALRRPEAAARINECNESRTLCFYARLFARRPPRQDVFRGQATFIDFGQKTRKRPGMTRLGSPGLSSQSVMGFSGLKGPKKPETDRDDTPGLPRRVIPVRFRFFDQNRKSRLGPKNHPGV